jgi:hypothetical protein
LVAGARSGDRTVRTRQSEIRVLIRYLTPKEMP